MISLMLMLNVLFVDTALKAIVIKPYELPFGLLWKSIMLEDSLVVNTNRWSLLSSKVFWAESTKALIIRDLWVTYRDLILSNYPCCVKLTGKSGRGKSVFLRYLIFHILLEAKKRSNHAESTGTLPTADHSTDPRIAFMDRGNLLYHITKDEITIFGNQYELVAVVGQPHFFFSDNVDVYDAGDGSLVTMAISSGDSDVLKEFSKRMHEARSKSRSILVMPGLDLTEMLQVFPDLPPQEVTFKFDVVGGNPRLAFALSRPGMKSTTHYQLVSEVVEMMFSNEKLCHKQWALDVVCSALEKAVTNKDSDALDSSTFRDFVQEDTSSFREVFASRFMGFVASRIHSAGEETTKAALLKLFGFPGVGAFFEYEAQLAFFKAGQNVVYHCLCQRTGKIVEFFLGGGNPMLIRNIEDLRTLCDGDSGIPTVSNYPIIDKVLYRSKKFGLQMTNALEHISGVAKLPNMLNALGIQNEQDFSIIFVVPEDHLACFVFPTNLGGVSMYLTTSRPGTKGVIEKEVKKRRKI